MTSQKNPWRPEHVDVLKARAGVNTEEPGKGELDHQIHPKEREMQRIFTGVLVLAALASGVRTLLANETLRGITSLEVVVEEIDESVRDAGLTKERVRTDVELRLRKAGIDVADSQKAVGLRLPYLYVEMSIFRMKGGALFPHCMRVSLRQDCYVARDPTVRAKFAETWHSTGLVGAVGERMLAGLRNDLADLVDSFINDYLAANPRQR